MNPYITDRDIGALVAVGTAGGAVWQRNQKMHYRAVLQAQEAHRESETRYQTTLLSIGDGVIVTDAGGQVVLLNPVAEVLTGWSDDEARGKPLEEVFCIINEDTRQPVENPVRRVVREGVVVGLANHTLLITKDGREIPIADSGAPTYETGGSLSGVVLVFRDQTEERAAQKALQDSEAYIRTILDNLPVGVAVNSADPTVTFSYMNENFVRCYRTTREALANLDAFWEAVYEDVAFRETMRIRVLEDIASGDPERMHWKDIPITRKGAETTYVSARNTPIIGQQLMLSTVWDTTERKKAQEALQVSEKKYRDIVETAQEGIWIIDAENKTTFVNQRMAEMIGYTVDEMLGRSLFTFMDDEGMAQAEANVGRWRQGLAEQHEFVFRRKDGSTLWGFLSTNAIFDQQGQYCGAQALVTDVTDLKRTQQAEHEQRLLAEALAQTSNALISTLSLDAVMSSILDNLSHVVPHDASNIMLIENDLIRIAYWRGYHLEQIAFLQNLRLQVNQTSNLHYMLVTEQPFLASYTDQYADWLSTPETEWVKSYVAAPIRSHGQVIGFLNVDSGIPGLFTEDHAQRLQAFADQASVAIEHAQLYEQIQSHANELEQRVIERTAQLNHAKERVEAIFNSGNDVMILCRTDGCIEQVNPAFDATFQCKRDEVYGQPLTRLAVPEHTAALEQAFIGVVESQNSSRFEITVNCPHRTPFDADIVLSPILGSDRMLMGVVCSLRDMTQHKQMQEQLRQMLEHEMEVSELKSRYVSMAAHDMRNPLAVIHSAVTMIHRYGDRLSEESKQQKYDNIHTNIQVMVDMLDDILTLGTVESGKLTFEPASLDVVTFCQNIAAEIGQAAVPITSRILFSSQGNCGMAYMDAKLLRHILGNLLSNALKYSPDEKPVILTVCCEPDQIIFSVQDQGIGIPQADQERLFETFHRASNARQIPGTGLGLAIVKQSVELHSGTITFESEEGQGTIFTVVIPQVPSVV